MGNEQVQQEFQDNQYSQRFPAEPPIPVLQEANVKYFGSRWRTHHDKFQMGTLTVCNDGTITYVNSETNIETSIPITALTSIGECTITIEYPVTLLIVSYNNRQNKNKSTDAAFLLPQYQIWLDVLRHLSNLQPHTLVHTPECPICLMEAEEYTHLVNCNHMICKHCLFNYIKSQIKDASKYPMKCFNFKCNVMLHMSDIHFALSGLPDAQELQLEHKDEEKQVQLQADEDNKIIKQITYQVLCICDKTMQRVHMHPDNICCNVCMIKIEKETDFYHCASENEQQHPHGYDVCIECGEVRMQTQSLKDTQLPICECGDVLKPIMPNKCYGSNNGVVCDECKQTSKDVIVWHCMKTFVDPHQNGYDLCIELQHNIRIELQHIFKSQQDLRKEELRFEKKELQRTTSDEKKEIISSAIIDCCNVCWLQFYRGLCSVCNYEYCLECRQQWHPDIDCVQEKREKDAKTLKDDQDEKLNQTFFKQRGFVKCPRCGVMIEKTDGCNAIPHKCKTKDEAEYTQIYVCHCCGAYLKDHDHERDGTNHFPDGPFAICRIKKQ